MPAGARGSSLAGMTTATLPGVREARDRYVSAAVSAPPLVVTSASGARIQAEDGRTYIAVSYTHLTLPTN